MVIIIKINKQCNKRIKIGIVDNRDFSATIKFVLVVLYLMWETDIGCFVRVLHPSGSKFVVCWTFFQYYAFFNEIRSFE